MELQSCIEQRRSVRKYKTQPVPREQLREIIQAAIFAPSWKNSQTSRYYVAEGEAKTELENVLPNSIARIQRMHRCSLCQRSLQNVPVLRARANTKHT